jgi:excisionase family DNA binding protein
VTESPEVWLSLKQAATEIEVARSTLRGYIRKGLLPVRRIRGSRLLRIRRTDLLNLLEDVPVTTHTITPPRVVKK